MAERGRGTGTRGRSSGTSRGGAGKKGGSKPLLNISKKKFIIIVCSVCALAVIAEVILLVSVFGKRDKTPAKEKKITPGESGQVYRLVAKVELGTDFGELYEYAYDSRGNRIQEVSYYAVRKDGIEDYFNGSLRGRVYSYTTFSYDSEDRMTESKKSCENKVYIDSYTYDGEGLLSGFRNEMQDGKGETTSLSETSLDGEGRLLTENHSDGTGLRYTYDENGGLITEIEYHPGYEVVLNNYTLTYGKNGRLEKRAKLDEKGDQWWWEDYDERGNVVSAQIKDWRSTNGTDSRTAITYDQNGNMLTYERHDYVADYYGSCNYGNVFEKYDYDEAGRLVKSDIDYDVPTEGRMMFQNTSSTRITEYEYDEETGRLIRTKYRFRNMDVAERYEEKEYKYDQNGNLTEIWVSDGITPLRLCTVFKYEEMTVLEECFSDEDRRQKELSYDESNILFPGDSMEGYPLRKKHTAWGEVYYR